MSESVMGTPFVRCAIGESQSVSAGVPAFTSSVADVRLFHPVRVAPASAF